MTKYRDFFNKLDNSINEVFCYGFNYGVLDIPYIKYIIKIINEKAIWYFTKFDSLNKEFMRKNKIELRKLGFKGKFDIY